MLPVKELKAGIPYLVTVKESFTLEAQDVLLRAVQPDSLPVLWEGGAMQGFYGKSTSRRSYQTGASLNELGNKTALPSYRAVVNLSPELNKYSGRPMYLEAIDYDNLTMTVNLENLQARSFLRDANYTSTSSTSIISKYNIAPPGRRDQPHTVVIPVPEIDYIPMRLYVQYSLNPDMSESVQKSFAVNSKQVEIANLIPGKTYYFKMKTTRGTIAQGQINTEGQLRMIKVPSGNNVRDLGGWPTGTKKHIRYGLVFRGAEMNVAHVLNETDVQELRRLNILAEVDLRRDSDLGGQVMTSSALGSDVPYIYLNQDDWSDIALGDYTEMYNTVFNFILNNLRAGRSVYFHCVAGADRTGALAFLLEGLLGVNRNNICKDYELTSFSLWGLREKTGLDSKFNYITALEGSTLQQQFYNYWNEQVGIPAEDLDEFINIMTESETDGIEAIPSEESAMMEGKSEKSQVYDLSGRPSIPSARNIYIVGGNKVVMGR